MKLIKEEFNSNLIKEPKKTVSLNLYKSADKSFSVIGEEIIYRIEALNDGIVKLENINIYDLLSPSLIFVDNSITINGVIDYFGNIVNGINIGSLMPMELKVITFKAKIIDNTVHPIENIAKGTFKYNLDNKYNLIGNTNSNMVRVIPEIVNVEVEKFSDSDFVVLNDVIIYKVKLKNLGTVDAMDVIFKDQLPEEVELLDGSFIVNGRIINSADITVGINIGNILVGCSTFIKYAVKVVKVKCAKNIVNSAKVNFYYQFPDGRTGYGESLKNLVSTKIITVGISNFKQISVADNIDLSCLNWEIEEITEITANVDIKNYNIIKTPTMESVEGQILTKYKAIIYANINMVIEYVACDGEQSVYSLYNPIRFSTFIVLPESFQPGEVIELKGIVEDIYFKYVNKNNLFINNTVLMKACLSDDK